MEGLLLHEARVNLDKGYNFYDERTPIDGSIFENVEPDDLPGELFRYGRSEYGRCVGKVFVDTRSRGTIHTGYVFQKRENYSDCEDTYLAETWLSVERVVEPARPTVVESVDLGGTP